jgi:diacylglycerol kinase (ATP)
MREEAIDIPSRAKLNPAMRRVALIYNPISGRYSARRAVALKQAIAVLRGVGVEVEAFEAGTPGSGAAHAREAVRQGCDSVIACGGDGTVHAVLQGLVGTETALGVIPLGTANALASNLGLVGPPADVVQKLLASVPVRIPVGRIHYQAPDGNSASRYFLVAAGIGPDALLMSRLDSRLKQRFGYALYLVEAARIWATHNFPLFETELIPNGIPTERVFTASQLLAVRVRSFGGALRQLAPGATLHNGWLHLIAFETRSRLAYFKFLIGVLAGRHKFTHEIELFESGHVECRAHNGSQETLFVEADGEVLGSLPVRLEVVPHAVNLLIPPGVEA